jgi:hypothetical protein
MKSNGYGRVTVLDGTLPTYCMFLLRRFEPQITAIQIANMKANPTITIFMATLRSRRACQRQAHGSSIVFFGVPQSCRSEGTSDQTADGACRQSQTIMPEQSCAHHTRRAAARPGGQPPSVIRAAHDADGEGRERNLTNG